MTYIDDETFKELYALVDEISRMIMALCQHLLKTA
ncbi:MAG: hypothetical protein IPG58_10850 [Acidobacteria bacterium]|nr:hypothetical protein [Acidobacteriota bacterium]